MVGSLWVDPVEVLEVPDVARLGGVLPRQPILDQVPPVQPLPVVARVLGVLDAAVGELPTTSTHDHLNIIIRRDKNVVVMIILE